MLAWERPFGFPSTYCNLHARITSSSFPSKILSRLEPLMQPPCCFLPLPIVVESAIPIQDYTTTHLTCLRKMTCREGKDNQSLLALVFWKFNRTAQAPGCYWPSWLWALSLGRSTRTRFPSNTAAQHVVHILYLCSLLLHGHNHYRDTLRSPREPNFG
jgi:hypothetical protein